MAIAALNIVYGLAEYPWEGPRPISTSTVLNGDGTKTITISFTDVPFTYIPTENSGFYACALADDVQCDHTNGSWTLVRNFLATKQYVFYF